MSFALDTNVLVRLLIADDPEQGQAAATLVQVAFDAGVRTLVPQGVILETEWVLRSRYKLSRDDIAGAFTAILETHELEVQDAVTFEEALKLFKDVPGTDFSDCMHAANTAHSGRTLATFDKKASRLPGTALIPE